MPARALRRAPVAFPALRAPLPVAIAHRGGTWEHPENTGAAFEASYRLGLRYFETDARATKDGVCLAFHDGHLGRVTGQDARIRDHTWAQVRRLRIHGHAEILRLDELLLSFPDVVFNVDLKERAAIGPFLDVVRRTGSADRIVVASFSHARLQAARRALGPRMASSLSPREIAGLRLAADGRPNGFVPRWAACAQVPETFGGRRIVDPAFVGLCHDLGLQVHVWTVNDPAAMGRLLDLGVDAIMTDRPAVLREVLQDRGQWHEPT
jgi:glycerophosphoryl diester phosphodiesterase